ncbi:MAG: hypothetical protein PF693_12395 [Spirochaetia bacterium]|nr:hypothetical protein [Spirochaetia bacterium]
MKKISLISILVITLFLLNTVFLMAGGKKDLGEDMGKEYPFTTKTLIQIVIDSFFYPCYHVSLNHQDRIIIA